MTLALLLVMLACIVSLLSGGEFLLWLLPGSLPLGTALAAVGLLAGATIPLRVRPGGRGFRRLALATIVLAVSWLPAGVMFAGNAHLNFTGGPASIWFHRLTLLTAGAVLFMLALTVWRVIRQVLEISEFDE